MKYIVLADNTPVVFPETSSHNFVAGDRMVIAAGFCRIETKRNEYDDIRATVSVWGNSHTLKVQSRPEDAELIASMFR